MSVVSACSTEVSLCISAAAGALLSAAQPAASAARACTTIDMSASPAAVGLEQLASEITPVATASCAAPAVSGPVASAGDTNSYALLPGESADNFTGSG